jgi:hypothetical protein
LPVRRVELKIAGQVHTAEVGDADTVKGFTVEVPAGPADIESVLLDVDGNALCGAYYVAVMKSPVP